MTGSEESSAVTDQVARRAQPPDRAGGHEGPPAGHTTYGPAIMRSFLDHQKPLRPSEVAELAAAHLRAGEPAPAGRVADDIELMVGYGILEVAEDLRHLTLSPLGRQLGAAHPPLAADRAGAGPEDPA